jgi:zinc resistance-associated protein
MKKVTMILGILVLVGAVAVPVMAFGPGWGWGHHMMGYWDNGPGYGRDYGNLTSEQRSRLNDLDQKYYEETRDLRNQLWTKSGELDAVLSSATPDLSKAKVLQNEISELRTKLDEKTLAYELEARKIAPDQRSGYGYGHHMMGPYYGRGMGYYGPGYCWN